MKIKTNKLVSQSFPIIPTNMAGLRRNNIVNISVNEPNYQQLLRSK